MEKITCKCKPEAGSSLLDALQQQGVYVPALCAGKGRCGKCKVKILQGEVPVTDADREKLSEDEIREGIRLACKACPTGEVTVEILAGEEEKIAVATIEKNEEKSGSLSFVAIDIGTTTIAMALVDETTGEVEDTFAALNRQRMYGADVISRIGAANEGKGELLKELIREELWRGLQELTRNNPGTLPEYIVIAGNTTMVHLLMGYSCESLGHHPFESKHLDKIETRLSRCIPQTQDSRLGGLPVTILPGLSAFVGGDIVSGLLVCPGFAEEEISLLLDLGTNGEMVLGSRERMFATSTAAGPAFEGGNMEYGTGSIPGAVSRVKIMNRRPVVGTIGEVYPPVGICGTGFICAIAELKKNRLLDSRGSLVSPYDEEGYPLWRGSGGEKILISQKDIRQFQLAKAAIRAGIEKLLDSFGCTMKEVSHLYFAGGFGTKLPVEEAIAVGLLPGKEGEDGFSGEIHALGNSSLRGAIRYGLYVCDSPACPPEIVHSDRSRETKLTVGDYLQEIREKTRVISLAEDEDFGSRYFTFLDL